MRVIHVAIALLVLAGSGASQRAKVRDREGAWAVPESAAAKPNPLSARPETEAGGAKIFRERCTACHADNGHGTTRGPNLAAADVQAQTDGALFWKISHGDTRLGMPSFSFLPDLQRWQLVLHVRTLARKAGH